MRRQTHQPLLVDVERGQLRLADHGRLRPVQVPPILDRNRRVGAGNHTAESEGAVEVALVAAEEFTVGLAVATPSGLWTAPTDRDGYELAATAFVPSRPLRAAVVLNSATAVPRRIYRGFATYLAQRDFAVLTYDYRGVRQ